MLKKKGLSQCLGPTVHSSGVQVSALSFFHLLVGCMQFGSIDQGKCEACGCLNLAPTLLNCFFVYLAGCRYVLHRRGSKLAWQKILRKKSYWQAWV